MMKRTKSQLQRLANVLELSVGALSHDNKRLRKTNRGLRRIIKTLRHVTHP